MEYFSIKNWKKYQHYKDRRPPWIKLHNALFDDYEYQALSDASKLHLITIWLLASRSNKVNGDEVPLLPCDEKYLTKQSGMKSPLRLKPLIDKGFLIVASNMLAGGLQDATLETEAYKEEAETKNIYMEFVFLTDTEHQKLKDKLGLKVEDYIGRLNDYVGAHGKKYKSHYHAILNFHRRDEKEGKPQSRFPHLAPGAD